jgi:DNA-binding winged helix-turn-helix (wHTH) protein
LDWINTAAMLWQFGECRMDPDRRELSRDGTPCHLTPKAFDLLVALIEQRPRVLSKQELIDRIWPDAFVADINLTVLIVEIRAAIGDRARQPRFLRTMHRRGYAFTGDVTERKDGAAATHGGKAAVIRIGARRIVLARGECTVGRDTACDIVINDGSISRKHAVLAVTAQGVELRDVSKNGTRVRGERVTRPTPLKSGDVIVFGNIEAQFSIEVPDQRSTMSIDVVDV